MTHLIAGDYRVPLTDAPPSVTIGNATLYLGDCLNVLPLLTGLPSAVVTDPPYGLSFMNRHWDYEVPSVEIWRQCLRVLPPGGHLLSFAGTRTHHRMAVNIEDAGFELRDMIAWVYGSGFPKSRNLDGDWQGWGTALKPAFEPITVARKPFLGPVAANVLQHGTGALNVDRCRVASEPGGRPLREVHPLREDVTYTGNSLAGRVDGSLASSKAVGSTDLGRWPANLIHDGSEEVVELFPVTTQSGYRTNPSTNKSTWYGAKDGSHIEGERGYKDTGSAARFFYCAKASKSDRGPGNNHPTVKPTELLRYLCRLVTPPQGTVLDPFMGSGSTGKAALLEGFRFIGIERDPEYFEIAVRRLRELI